MGRCTNPQGGYMLLRYFLTMSTNYYINFCCFVFDTVTFSNVARVNASNQVIS